MENITKEQVYKCRHCGDPINWGEYHTFEVCDTCFDENYKARTASGSVAAPKEEPIVNEVLYDNGEHSHLELLDHDGRIICSESELESLRDFVRDVDASLYHGPDLEDKEIMQHYIEVFKIIKEEARKLMNTCIQQTEQPEEAKIIEELKAKGARSFINENTALREALKDLLAITETNVFNYNEYKAIIERARKLLSK